MASLAAEHHRARLCRRALLLWRARAAEAEVAEAILVRRALAVQRAALAAWALGAAERRETRMKADAAAEHRRGALLRSHLRRWRDTAWCAPSAPSLRSH